MNRQVITIILILIILFLGLVFGLPIEFLNTTTERLSTIILEIIVALAFIQAFRLTRYVDKKITKWVTVGFISLLAIPYLLGGIMTTLLVTSSRLPMWQDVAIYTKADGEKVISQWRETSGSIYDYRCRKTLADFGQIRISFDVNPQNMKGLWTEHLIEKDSTFIIDLDKDIVDYSAH